MACQIIPKNDLDFRRDREALRDALRAGTPDVTWYSQGFNPYPWTLEPRELHALERLLGSLRRAICALVNCYSRDVRLRELVLLSPEVEELLRVADRRPYKLDAFRPDFVTAIDGTVEVSEINARFPLNGFLITHFLDRALQETTSGRDFGSSFASLPSVAGVPQVLRDTVGDAERIVVLKGRERGWDVRILMDAWPQCEAVAPDCWSGEQKVSDFVVLELHQEEIMETLPRSALLSLVENGRYLNDVRTIFIGHDKRLLAALTSEIVCDYLEADDVQRLREHVIPTYVVGRGGEPVRRARANPEDWVLKPNLRGKGEGIVMGRHVSRGAWHSALDSAHPHFVLQRYVEQRSYDILTEVDGEVRTVPMNVVGLLPSLGEHSLGPGIFRASREPIVNVSRGGTVLAPVVLTGRGRTDDTEA
ncbi:MAG: hypothetical protein P4L84_09515 [Isosphaeraceae bacterium]|nr:hypothetical protein [Isosphaeraceae bacterium]